MRTVAIGLLLFMAFGFGAAKTDLPSAPRLPSLLYTSTPRYESLAWIGGDERFTAGATIFVAEGTKRHALVANFAATADPAVSFDGKSVLFAGKQSAADLWQIWEISVAGGDPRRITNCPQGCVRPFYLPEQRVVYAEKIGHRFVIHATTEDGKVLALTHAAESSLPTDVLQDGRILFESTFPLGETGLPELFTVYSDGSGVESYRCDHGHARYSGKQVGSGEIVFASERGLGQFKSALAREVPLAAPKGDYAGDIAETPSGQWLLPWRPDKRSVFQLMTWSPTQGNLHPAIREAGSNVLQPVLLMEHPAPKRHPSALHDWSVGNLLCLNAYTSKYKFAATSLHSVRVYSKDANGTVLLLGSAPVEPDGSFFIQIPGDQPLQIELLDSDGKSLKREQGWFWLRRGEQRACVGCHAGPETAPENAMPMVLLRSTNPADLTGQAAQASAGGH